MLVKVFTSKGPLNGVHGKLRHRGNQFHTVDWTPTLEAEINRWLFQNPAITISEIRQSSVSGWFGRRHCVITIWYEPPKVILSLEAAQKLVLEHVGSPDNRDGIVITEVIERPFGWVFCYNSKRYVETSIVWLAITQFLLIDTNAHCTASRASVELSRISTGMKRQGKQAPDKS